MSFQDNFFTSELYRYYLGYGKKLSEKVIRTLNKSASELTEEETNTYTNIILPARQNIKEALSAIMLQSEKGEQGWQQQLLVYSQSIIGQIAGEMLSEQEEGMPPPVRAIDEALESEPGTVPVIGRGRNQLAIGPERKRGKIFKALVIILISLFALLAVMGTLFGIYAWRFNRAWKSIVIEEVNLSRVPDGVYEGSYSSFHDSAMVRVTVQYHQICQIEIVEQSPGDKLVEMEDLVRWVLYSQSPDVDAVSGSSASSKVFLKAIENALSSAQS